MLNIINQDGGQVTIINPPYRSQPRAWPRNPKHPAAAATTTEAAAGTTTLQGNLRDKTTDFTDLTD